MGNNSSTLLSCAGTPSKKPQQSLPRKSPSPARSSKKSKKGGKKVSPDYSSDSLESNDETSRQSEQPVIAAGSVESRKAADGSSTNMDIKEVVMNASSPAVELTPAEQLTTGKQQLATSKQQLATKERHPVANKQKLEIEEVHPSIKEGRPAVKERQPAANKQKLATNKQQLAINKPQVADKQQVAANEGDNRENLLPFVDDDEADINDALSEINSVSVADADSQTADKQQIKASEISLPHSALPVLQDDQQCVALEDSEQNYCKFHSSESLASTNEELQATLQELGDLQRNVNQLAEENEELGAERMVLLESLCTQTAKLDNARTQIEHLKALILSDTDHTQTEREQELVNLLKIATEEREEFLLKQCEIHNALESFDLEYKDMQERVISLNDKCKHLEDKRQGAMNEKTALETQISDLVEELANEKIELDRYKTLLENEKGKVLELQQLHKAEDKSELEQLVENTRADKEKVEQKCANLQESLAHSRRELTKTKEQMQSLEAERCKAKERADTLEQELVSARNNNKTCLSDLEYKYDKVTADRGQLESDMSDLRKELDNQRKENNRILEENKNFKISVSDLQAELKGAKHRYIEFEKEMKALSQRHDEEASDWKQFQSDLQTAVVIANAIKAEAVDEKELLAEKNREILRRLEDTQKQCGSLQAELERVKAQKGLSILPTGEIKKHLLGSDRELVALRQGRRLSDIRGNQNIVSVKSLIKTIEGQGSLGSSTGSSRRGSSDSLNSPTNSNTAFSNHVDSSRASPERRTNSLNNNNNDSVPLRSVLKKPKDSEDKSTNGRTRSVMYEKTSAPVIESLRPVSSDNSVSSLLSIRNENEHSEKSYDPLAKLVKQTGGSKRNALLKWCQYKTREYREVDVTNFSSSWNDGLAFCALLHNYIPDLINYNELIELQDKRENFSVAFQAAESVGISRELDVDEMVSIERPDWQMVMSYVTSIYLHFEAD